MQDAPVTIFGGTGFLGRSLAARLRQADVTVRTVARHAAGPDDTGEQFQADIRDGEAVSRALDGARAAVNAVSLYVEHYDARFEDIHVRAAAELARRARAAGVERFVHVSGIGADPRSRSRYVAARGRGEAAVREAFPDAVIVRPSVLCGRGDAFVSTLERLTCLPVVPLFGDGSVRLQPVHVDDVAAAVVRLLTNSLPEARTLELGGGDVLSYRDIVRRVMDHLGRRRVLLPVPMTAWRGMAGVASLLPSPPLTDDQVLLMAADNVASGPGFEALEMTARGFDEILAESLSGGSGK